MSLETFLNPETGGLREHLLEKIRSNPSLEQALGQTPKERYSAVDNILERTRKKYGPLYETKSLLGKAGKVTGNFLQKTGSLLQASSLLYGTKTPDYHTAAQGYVAGTLLKVPTFAASLVNGVRTGDLKMAGLQTVAAASDLILPGSSTARYAAGKFLEKVWGKDPQQALVQSYAVRELEKKAGTYRPWHERALEKVKGYAYSGVKDRSKNIFKVGPQLGTPSFA
ncbi:hypothetical protein H6501_03565 [Candidatus Woesearchaeota archaeon]|nr:hypothetical protein [Nanoarchaeota archaeon]MCB9370648.1 hypothetical protein [Candidatus Woesearchaeota archaeon]USN43732.1 MAG: hypothetical protein H6500_05065 [Candidatus Woesearchaeota archaeon]